MSNEPMGSRAEGYISDDIKKQTAFVKVKRREAVEHLVDYGQALVDGDMPAAQKAMDALDQAARAASEAERRITRGEDVLDNAKAYASDLGTWRDIVPPG